MVEPVVPLVAPARGAVLALQWPRPPRSQQALERRSLRRSITPVLATPSCSPSRPTTRHGGDAPPAWRGARSTPPPPTATSKSRAMTKSYGLLPAEDDSEQAEDRTEFEPRRVAAGAADSDDQVVAVAPREEPNCCRASAGSRAPRRRSTARTANAVGPRSAADSAAGGYGPSALSAECASAIAGELDHSGETAAPGGRDADARAAYGSASAGRSWWLSGASAPRTARTRSPPSTPGPARRWTGG